eukprot:scaffold125943_cov60-Phaeocystis_antarctica.AAC.4
MSASVVNERAAEALSLDWNWVDLQRVALQGQDEDAPTACLYLPQGFVVCDIAALDEIEAVLHDAKARRPLPLARDRAAVLASERKDLQAIVLHVADEQLLAYHRQPTRIIEQRLPEPVARLQRVGVEGDYFVLVIIGVVLFIGVRLFVAHAEEKAARRAHGAVSCITVWVLVACDLGAVVSEPQMERTESSGIDRLLVGGYGGQSVVAGKASARAHVAIEDAYRVAGAHHQLLIGARDHRHVIQVYEQLRRKVERHSRQAAAALAGSLPALRPQ